MAAAFPLGRRASGGYHTDRTRNGHGATHEPSSGLGNPGGGNATRKTPAANTSIRGYRNGERAIGESANVVFCKYLKKSCFLETEETPAVDHSLADDDVIQEMDLKNLRSRRHALGDL